MIAEKLEKAKHALDAGDLSTAQALSREVIEEDPQAHEGFYILGLLAMRTGRPDLAYKFVLHAASLSPKSVSYHITLTDWYYKDHKINEAITHARLAVEGAPDSSQARYNMGVMEGLQDHHDEALTHYLAADEISPNNAQTLFNIAVTYNALGDPAKEIETYQTLIATHPDFAHGFNNLGLALAATGDLDGARDCYSRAIELDGELIDAHLNLSPLKTYTDNDPHLDQLELLAQKATQDTYEKERYIWFCVGKAREDTGQFDAAFEAYERGNALHRQTIELDEATSDLAVERVLASFTADLFEGWKHQGCQDNTPIFILGMPRSGTTLIEQVLASHSSVYGGDELRFLLQVSEEARLRKGVPDIVDLVHVMTADEKADVGKAYIECARTVSGDATFITDKMPSNYYLVGLIPLILPNAKIIHSRRNPMDICFSNYARLFKEGQKFTYDLAEMGREYVRYDRLMSHWHKVLPEGLILDVQYEDMVSDIDTQARRLLEHCGLPWEDQVLEFHKNKRAVTTASAAQVRKPIYASSVARWQRFEKHLGPLKEALGARL